MFVVSTDMTKRVCLYLILLDGLSCQFFQHVYGLVDVEHLASSHHVVEIVDRVEFTVG